MNREEEIAERWTLGAGATEMWGDEPTSIPAKDFHWLLRVVRLTRKLHDFGAIPPTPTERGLVPEADEAADDLSALLEETK